MSIRGGVIHGVLVLHFAVLLFRCLVMSGGEVGTNGCEGLTRKGDKVDDVIGKGRKVGKRGKNKCKGTQLGEEGLVGVFCQEWCEEDRRVYQHEQQQQRFECAERFYTLFIMKDVPSISKDQGHLSVDIKKISCISFINHVLIILYLWT